MSLSGLRTTFLIKVGVMVLLAAAFDQLFPFYGSTVGLFALLWMLGLLAARAPVRRRAVPSRLTLAVAGWCTAALLYAPGMLAWTMLWAALSIAALLPRTYGFDDARRWGIRLLLQAVSVPLAPITDLARLLRARPRGRRPGAKALASMLALPLVGSGIFIALFAAANPLISDFLAHISWPSPARIFAWCFAVLIVWPTLRPMAMVTRLGAKIQDLGFSLRGTSLPSVLLALGLFNILFGIQNGLDIAFLWSGAPLPPGMSMTEYVHRGAYPLIVTALLAGFLVLTMLRPGTEDAADRRIRGLVLLWVGQNVLLVASSALRTLRYIDENQLTEWRIAALLWMALVATGLVLIIWRIQRQRSSRWLINANAAAAAVVLLPCCFVDLGAIAASWNLRHAREVGGHAAPLDLCYMQRLGDASLLALIEAEKRPLAPTFVDELRYLRERQIADLMERQADWRGWTPLGALRLTKAQALLGPTPPRSRPTVKGEYRDCGRIEGQDEPLTGSIRE